MRTHKFADAAGNVSPSLPCPVPAKPGREDQPRPPHAVRLYGAGAVKELRTDAAQALTGALLLAVLSA